MGSFPKLKMILGSGKCLQNLTSWSRGVRLGFSPFVPLSLSTYVCFCLPLCLSLSLPLSLSPSLPLSLSPSLSPSLSLSLIKYLLTELGRSVRRYSFALCLCTDLGEAPWSAQRPRAEYPSVRTSRLVNKNIRI